MSANERKNPKERIKREPMLSYMVDVFLFFNIFHCHPNGAAGEFETCCLKRMKNIIFVSFVVIWIWNGTGFHRLMKCKYTEQFFYFIFWNKNVSIIFREKTGQTCSFKCKNNNSIGASNGSFRLFNTMNNEIVCKHIRNKNTRILNALNVSLMFAAYI